MLLATVLISWQTSCFHGKCSQSSLQMSRRGSLLQVIMMVVEVVVVVVVVDQMHAPGGDLSCKSS